MTPGADLEGLFRVKLHSLCVIWAIFTLANFYFFLLLGKIQLTKMVKLCQKYNKIL
jgi:hypothetical protein